jgi:hypothetical protein
VLPVLAVAAAVLAAPAAGSDGGPSPGAVAGWNGVLAPIGTIRYAALPTGRSTIVTATEVDGGRVLEYTTIRGRYGVPLVGYDGSTGGVSGDGSTLVLAPLVTPVQGGVTRFTVLATEKRLHLRKLVSLRGAFSFDAISRTGRTLFLIEYLSSPDGFPAYRVRAYDVARGKLVPGAIVDRREPSEKMQGSPVTRTSSRDGRWAYTLYARQSAAPFVHALDTIEQKAYCIDLPLGFTQQRQMGMRLRFHGPARIDVRSRYRTVAVVDMQKLEARKA